MSQSNLKVDAFTNFAEKSPLNPTSLQESPVNNVNSKNCEDGTPNPDHCVKLNNGVLMPKIGFGTYKLTRSVTIPTIHSALQAGYTMIDTAHVYGGQKTEGLVGEALQKIPTESRPFIITKVWRNFHGYEQTKECLKESLHRLGLEQVDLVLIHWPGPAYNWPKKENDPKPQKNNNNTKPQKKNNITKKPKKTTTITPNIFSVQNGQEDIASLRLETWRALEDAYLEGKCRAIGVSNFSIVHLEKLLSWSKIRIKPTVNQVEMHPYYNQKKLREFCSSHGIILQAYSSLGGQDFSKKDYRNLLGQPPVLRNPIVLQIARDKKKTSSQVLLRWAYQHGVVVIPKSEREEHILDNIRIFNFVLSKKEMYALDGLDRGTEGRLTWRSDPLRHLDFD